MAESGEPSVKWEPDMNGMRFCEEALHAQDALPSMEQWNYV